MHASSPAGVCQHGSARPAPRAAAAGARLSLSISARAGRQHNVEPWDTGSHQPGAEGAARRFEAQPAAARASKQASTNTLRERCTYVHSSWPPPCASPLLSPAAAAALLPQPSAPRTATGGGPRWTAA
jgi:hypothetical protein